MTWVIPTGSESSFGWLLDLTMLVIRGGQESTEDEYRKLHESARFSVDQDPFDRSRGQRDRGNEIGIRRRSRIGSGQDNGRPDVGLIEPLTIFSEMHCQPDRRLLRASVAW